VFSCSGYYRYDHGYQPDFAGHGPLRRHDRAPAGTGPRTSTTPASAVVVIGSGATAVTLIPSMAETAAHVTMLQRSPTYITSLPPKDPDRRLLRLLPTSGGRARRSAGSRRSPRRASTSSAAPARLVKRMLRKGVERQLPEGYDIDTHFTPRYDPWDQRLCVVPNGDLFKAIKRGGRRSSPTTSTRSPRPGIRLQSGDRARRPTSSSPPPGSSCDVIVVGAGLAGLVAATELADAGKRVIVVDQEGEQSLGGQAFWSFGGLFLVDSPSSAGSASRTPTISRCRTGWARRVRPRRGSLAAALGRGLCRFAAGEKRDWLRAMGHRIFPWSAGPSAAATMPMATAIRCRAFTSPGAPAPASSSRSSGARARRRRAAWSELRFRHRVDALTITNGGAVDGRQGAILEPSECRARRRSSRKVTGDFELRAQAVIVASGGIGGNHDLVRQNWPKRLGDAAEAT
jgi:hypothetical protein